MRINFDTFIKWRPYETLMKSVENVRQQLITREWVKREKQKERKVDEMEGTKIISQANQFTRQTHYSKWQQKRRLLPSDYLSNVA